MQSCTWPDPLSPLWSTSFFAMATMLSEHIMVLPSHGWWLSALANIWSGMKFASATRRGHGGIRKLDSGIRKLSVVFGNWYSETGSGIRKLNRGIRKLKSGIRKLDSCIPKLDSGILKWVLKVFGKWEVSIRNWNPGMENF